MGNPYDIHTEDNFEKFSSDLGVDHKIVLIKIIIDSQLKTKSQKKYVKLIVNSETPLSDVFHLKVAKKIDGKKLKPFFGWFVLMMGIYIIIKEIFFH